MTRHTRYWTVLALFVATLCALPPAARAQPPAPAAQPPEAQPAPPAPADDDDALDVMEPDFVVVNLPTTLRLPVHKGNFHLTHRFEGNLRAKGSDFGDQLGNLFGVDVGATMGFEYRFGIMRHVDAIAMRTNRGRAIEFSAKYDGWHQSATIPVSISGVLSIEGDNNFGANTGGAPKNYAPALGLVVSRKIADRLTVYATPFWVHNTGTGLTSGENTGFLGLATRIRITSSTNFIVEGSPRLGGFVIGQAAYGFGIDKRVGAHVFAITFTNGTATTTYRQLARGGSAENLHLGFNLTRKFF